MFRFGLSNARVFFIAALFLGGGLFSSVLAASELILKGDNGEDFILNVDDPSGATNGSLQFGPSGSAGMKMIRQATNASDNAALGLNYVCTYDGATCVEVASMATLYGTYVSQITAGNGIAVDQNTGNVTISLDYDDTSLGLDGSNQLSVKDGGVLFAAIEEASIITDVEDDTAGNSAFYNNLAIGDTNSTSDSLLPTAKAITTTAEAMLVYELSVKYGIADADSDVSVSVSNASGANDYTLFRNNYATGNDFFMKSTAGPSMAGNPSTGSRIIDFQKDSGGNSGQFVFTGGHSSQADSDYAFAFGYQADVKANYGYGHATGDGTAVSGLAARAHGDTASTQGDYAHSHGKSTWAWAKYAHASGFQSTALGEVSHTGTYYAGARSYGMHTYGIHSEENSGNTTTWVGTDPLFVVANGASTPSRSEAIAMTKDGDTTLTGDWTWGAGADVCISGGNCLGDALITGDNLGDHTATEDLQMTDFDINLGGGYVSNDGDEEGLSVDNSGIVQTSANLVVAGELTASSDERLKQSIQDFVLDPEDMEALVGVTYTWKDSSRGEGEKVGFIAQNVERIYPSLVSEQQGYKSVHYQTMVVPLLASAQDLSHKNQQLRDRIEAVIQKLEILESS